MNKNRAKKLRDSENLSFEDDYEENGFINTVVGHSLSSFSFSEGEVSSPVSTVTNDSPDSRKGRPCPNGVTPPVDGEAFDMKRTYAFRKSTIRKLNELKARHPDVNVYLSTILDEAVNYYYEHVVNGKKE